MKKMKIHHLFAFLFLMSFFLFSSAICEKDDDEEELITPDIECVNETILKAETIDKTNTNPRTNFMFNHDEELGDMFVYIVDVDDICVTHSVNITGTIYCKGQFCTGGFEWGVFLVVNQDEDLLDPVEFDCYSGKCEFDFTIPADYTNLFNTYHLSIMLVAFGDPGSMEPMNYFAWKIDRFELDIDYYTSH